MLGNIITYSRSSQTLWLMTFRNRASALMIPCHRLHVVVASSSEKENLLKKQKQTKNKHLLVMYELSEVLKVRLKLQNKALEVDCHLKTWQRVEYQFNCER